jgi:hypothetical protein
MVAHVRPSCCWLLLGCRPTADELRSFCLEGNMCIFVDGSGGAATHQCLLAALHHIVGACAMQRMRGGQVRPKSAFSRAVCAHGCPHIRSLMT